MKATGIEWIGEIPEEWEIVSLKRITTCLDGKRVPIEASLRGNMVGEIPYWGAGNIVDYVIDYIFDEELVLLGEDGAPFFDKTRNVAFYVNSQIWVNNHIHVLKTKSLSNAKFLTHVLNTVDYNAYINGSILSKLTQSAMNSIVVMLPPILEQQVITDFLDCKCEIIDSTIEKQKAVIEKLKFYKQSVITEVVTKGLNPTAKMKPSGIEWIGDIPEVWDVSTIKRKFLVINGSTPKSESNNYWNGNIIWITPAEMAENIVEIFDSKRMITQDGLKSCGTTLVPLESIIVSNRAPIGQVCIAGVELCTNQGCKSLVSKADNYNKFFYYFLSIQAKTLNMLGRGTTFLELSTYDLANFKIPYPSLPEQQKIADYLDFKCAGIDSVIKGKQKLIERITEYKKSLIYECVTGKREVM